MLTQVTDIKIKNLQSGSQIKTEPPTPLSLGNFGSRIISAQVNRRNMIGSSFMQRRIASKQQQYRPKLQTMLIESPEPDFIIDQANHRNKKNQGAVSRTQDTQIIIDHRSIQMTEESDEVGHHKSSIEVNSDLSRFYTMDRNRRNLMIKI